MTAKNTAGRKKRILAMILLFGPASFLVLIATRNCEHKFKELDDYGSLKSYSFVDARGKKFTSKDFENNIVLISTIQNSCPDTCAVELWFMQQHIYRIAQNSKDKDHTLKMISFVTDGEGNPVEDLTQVQDLLKDRITDYDPDVWYLAGGEARALYDMSSNGQTLLQKGDDYFGGEGYQELLLLVDKKNHLRMVLPGNEEGMIRRMKEHVALLQKQYSKEAAKRK